MEDIVSFDVALFAALLFLAVAKGQSVVGLTIRSTGRIFGAVAAPFAAILIFLMASGSDGSSGAWLTAEGLAGLALAWLIALYLVLVAASAVFALIFAPWMRKRESAG